jgi:His/Glu/Gln/Arg/opine family amino acid ABC transporter permease subunit
VSTEPSQLPQEVVERASIEISDIEGKGGLKNLPWWLFALILISVWVGLVVVLNDIYQEAFLFIVKGVRLTIIISLSAYVVALLLGLLAGLGRISQSVVFNNIATFYVEFVRGIPMLVLIFFIALVGVPSAVDGLNSLGNLVLGIHRLTTSDGQAAQPAWPPVGNDLAFVLQGEGGNGDILMLNEEANELTRLTDTPDFNEYYPVWSPDEAQLAYMVDVGQVNTDIYAVDRESLDLTPIATSAAFEGFPVWSPDGSQVAYLAQREGDVFDIYVVQPGEEGAAPITQGFGAYGDRDTLTTQLSWSPDGERIAFMMQHDGHVDIFTMRPDGSDVTQVTDAAQDALFPVWSPDGSRIAFVASGEDDIQTASVIDVDGGNLVQLTNGKSRDRHLRWSPDGQQIAFESQVDYGTEERSAINIDIFIAQARGGRLRRMMFAGNDDKWPTWSADGSQIAFSTTLSGSSEIYVVSTQANPFTPLGRILTSVQNKDVPITLRAIIALAVTYGAFLAEIFRAGIQSVGHGQTEAARSLGMSRGQAMRYVILPQAVRNVLPALGNDFVAMVKDSSLVSVLAVRDITQLARLYAGRTFRFRESYITLAVMYLTLTIILSFLVRQLERRLRRHARD